MDKMSLQDDVPHLQLLQQVFSSYKPTKHLNSVELYHYWLCYYRFVTLGWWNKVSGKDHLRLIILQQNWFNGSQIPVLFTLYCWVRISGVWNGSIHHSFLHPEGFWMVYPPSEANLYSSKCDTVLNCAEGLAQHKTDSLNELCTPQQQPYVPALPISAKEVK